MSASSSYVGRHRRVGPVVVTAHPFDFLPAHCTGAVAGGCTHPHPGEPAWGTFADLGQVDARCDRKGIHGGHDTDEGRCPGVRDQLPRDHVVRRAAQARAAIAGGVR